MPMRLRVKGRNDFGFETTLASRNYVRVIAQAKKLGYTVVLIFFWLESVDLAKARVKARVEKGGHNIPSTVIERRYARGLNNFFTIYKELVNSWMMYNNSHEIPFMLARGKSSLVSSIYNPDLWEKINEAYEH